MTSTVTRRVGAAVAAGIALAATATGGLAQAAPTEEAPAPSVATCHTSELRIGFLNRLGGGMNHAGGTLEFTNTAGHRCALRGYPGLGLENAGHAPLPTDTVWGTTWYADDPGNKLVYLKPGESAQAVVAWTHTGSEAHQAAYLEVTPPAGTTHRTIALNDLVDFGRLHVTALARTVPVRG